MGEAPLTAPRTRSNKRPLVMMPWEADNTQFLQVEAQEADRVIHNHFSVPRECEAARIEGLRQGRWYELCTRRT